jgi:S-adenosyl methyltransferase
MEKTWRKDATRRAKAALIDTTVPNAARVVDYLYGGPNNFETDRRAAGRLTAAAPVVGSIGPAGHAFHQRVVRYLVEAGIRQFIDIGTRLVMSGRTHEVAQSLAPESRVVYADSDPMVLSHTRALLRSTADGAVAFVDANVRDPRGIAAGAAGTLDFGRPVGVLFPHTLAFIASAKEAAGVAESLMGAVPPGSYLGVYHLASDVDPALPAAVNWWNQMSAQPTTLRSREQLAAILDGLHLELVPPGLVLVTDWRSAADDPRFNLPVPIYGVMARKP